VCGVVENYRNGIGNYAPKFEDGHNVIQLVGENGWSWRQIVKVRGDQSEALAAVRKVCGAVTKELIGYPKDMTCTFLDDVIKDALVKERNTMHLVLCFMFLSIMISALGLFAISVNYSEQHSKEIAICKIMGATVKESIWRLSWRFILMSLIAVVIAIPICVIVMRNYLQDFYYRIDFPWWVLLLSACITILIVILSILGQTMRIATKNPIDGIRTE
jgi:ABC-type antimicrobial peptide transport system permease subunit